MPRHFAEFPTFSAVYAAYPAESEECPPSTSEPFAIDFSFSAHERVTLAYPTGRSVTRGVRANAGGMTSGGPPDWIEVPGSCEFVEFRPSAALRHAIAEDLGVPAAAALADLHGIEDPVLSAASLRFRAHALGGWPLDGLEADALMETVVRRLVTTRLGGREPRSTGLSLDARRLRRVADYIEEHLAADLSIGTLARVAALSPYHFIRAFKATTGLTPHRYVQGRRMQRARDLLADESMAIGEVARRVGYADGHSFRRAFAQYFGQAPGLFRRH